MTAALSLFMEAGGGLEHLLRGHSVLKSLNTVENAFLVPRQRDAHLRQVPAEGRGKEAVCESRGSELSHPPMPLLVLPGPRVLTQLSAPAHTPWCPAQLSGSAGCSASCVWIQATQRHFDKGSHQSHSGWAVVGSPCGEWYPVCTPEVQELVVPGPPRCSQH